MGIDILIVEKEENKIIEENSDKEKDRITEAIQKIYNILFDTKNFTYIEMIKAKVPIIKCTLKETDINIDISFFRKN